MADPVLVASGVSKAYGGVAACAGIDLAVAPGTIHGLVGENGAGKSTLLRIIGGIIPADAGRVAVGGAPIAGAAAARRAGVGLVHQHFSQVAALDAVDNCLLARSGQVLDRAAAARRIAELAGELGFRIPLDRAVGALAVGDRQRLEMVKALHAAGGRPRVLLLDEPTAALAPAEVDACIAAIRRLAAAGTAVVFTGHKLAEIAALCATATVLRRGRAVYAGPLPPADELARLMVGEAPPPPARAAAAPGPPVLELSAVTVPGELHPASGAVHAGEVVAVAGVDGNGQAALVAAVLGRIAHAGAIRRPPAIGVIPEDRHHDGIVLDRDLAWNLGLGAHRRPPLARRGWLRPRAWIARADRLLRAGDVRGGGRAAMAGALSGGNQQKLVAARALDGDPPLVVAVNPTRGLDVAASRAVLGALAAARDRGAGVLLVHHDLDELLAIADRVWVLSAGRLLSCPERDRAAIGRLMLGGGP